MAGRRSREWFRALSVEGDVARVRLTTERGQVALYTVQYEAPIDGIVRPIVRYDNAHGRPHRDLLGWSGEIVAKEWLPDEPYGAAFRRALDDLDATWPRLRDAFLGRKP